MPFPQAYRIELPLFLIRRGIVYPHKVAVFEMVDSGGQRAELYVTPDLANLLLIEDSLYSRIVEGLPVAFFACFDNSLPDVKRSRSSGVDAPVPIFKRVDDRQLSLNLPR
jgi:hypothetical protein